MQIGDSAPAPLLTPIVGPSIESKRVAQSKQEYGERHRARLEYWTQLLDVAGKRTKLHSNVSPTRSPYVSTGAGVRGLSLQYWVRQEDARVLLWIDRGKEEGDTNRMIFEHFASARQEIENAFGGPLTWDSMEDSRSCKIIAEVPSAPGWRTPPEDREEGMEALVDAMIRLGDALGPQIKRLHVADLNEP